MTRIHASRTVSAPQERVWAAISDLGGHPRWMKDARSMVFLTDQRTGIGTRMEVETRVGPLRTLDQMEVVGWEEGRSIEVAHTGMVTGRGTLAIETLGNKTTVTWEESLTFPWWLGNGLTAWLARPVLARLWKGNLKRLAELVSSL